MARVGVTNMKSYIRGVTHREGPNLGKHRVPRLLLPSTLDAQFGTPYPRSAGFDIDTWRAQMGCAHLVHLPLILFAPEI